MKIGIVAGVHEDIVRLSEAFGVLEQRGCTEFASLGDIVGFSNRYYSFAETRDAHSCVQLIREKCKYSTLGNHDAFHARRIPTHSSFNYPEDWFSLAGAEKNKLGKDALWLYEDDLIPNITQSDQEYLFTLPEYQVAEFTEGNVFFSHYLSPNLIGDTVKVEKDGAAISQHFNFMQDNRCKISFFSHETFEEPELYFVDHIQRASFGKIAVSKFPVAIKIPWVANGTSPNGMAIFDTNTFVVEMAPLNTPPHKAS